MYNDDQQAIHINDFKTFIDQLSVLNIIDSAAALFDSKHQIVFSNHSFNKLNDSLSDSYSYSESKKQLIASPSLIRLFQSIIKSEKKQFSQLKLYYSKLIYVDLHLILTPVFENKGQCFQGFLLTIGEESINFNGKHLAASQEKITKLKNRVMSLDEEKLSYECFIQLLFKKAPMAMVIFNNERKILQINKNAETLFGISQTNAIGLSCSEILNCYHIQNKCPILKQNIDRIGIDEITCKALQNNAIPLLRSAVLFQNMTDEQVIFEVFMDIRETRKAQQESQCKSAFLSHMSHEIRTPLTAIIGYSQILLEEHEKELECNSVLHSIIRSAYHLQALLNNVLDLSKIEAGKFQVNRYEINTFQLLSEVESIVTSQIQAKKISFHLDYHFPIPAKIMTDPLLTKQILINLCNNAIKFTSEGSVSVQVFFKNQQLIIKVIDTGIGMTKEQLVDVFNAFAQAEKNTALKYGGTGLGLHLSKLLAHHLGGDIIVESSPNEGSCFTLSLDVEEQQSLELVYKILKPQHSDVLSLSKYENIISGEILLVEDNEDNQAIISHYIKKAGANVTIANNGKEAVEWEKRSHFDVILMDMQMPVMDGIEATKIIRANGFKETIVALSADVVQECIEKCLKAGCEYFLAKPIDKKMFFKTLRKLMPGYEMSENSIQNEKKIPINSIYSENARLRSLIDKFIVQFPLLLDILDTSFKAEDWSSFYSNLHNIKGVSGNMGFMEISHLSEKMMIDLHEKSFEKLTKNMQIMMSFPQRMK